MTRCLHTLAILLFLTAAVPASAQLQTEPQAPWGLAGGVSWPFGDFSTRYETGYGLHGIGDYTLLPILHLTGNVGFHYFNGKNVFEDLTVWEFAVGARFVLGAFYMGGESGYYTEVDEGSFVPNVGVRLKDWDIGMRWKSVGGQSWRTLRVGYYF